jgi:hypothetical protein
MSVDLNIIIFFFGILLMKIDEKEHFYLNGHIAGHRGFCPGNQVID